MLLASATMAGPLACFFGVARIVASVLRDFHLGGRRSLVLPQTIVAARTTAFGKLATHFRRILLWLKVDLKVGSGAPTLQMKNPLRYRELREFVENLRETLRTVILVSKGELNQLELGE